MEGNPVDITFRTEPHEPRQPVHQGWPTPVHDLTRNPKAQTEAKTEPSWGERLAQQFGIPWSEVPTHIKELTQVQAINKAFFEWKASRTESQRPTLPQHLRYAATNILKLPIEARIQGLKGTITTAENEMKKAASSMRRKVEAEREIEQLKNMTVPSLEESIIDVLAAGWWHNIDVEPTKYGPSKQALVFYTPVVQCRHYHEKAGIDITIPLGEFKVVYVPTEAEVKVLKYKDNVIVDNAYYHPHVCINGTICWGNSQASVAAAFKAYDVKAIFQIVRQILTEYNHGSPYAELTKFRDAAGLKPVQTNDYKLVGTKWVTGSIHPSAVTLSESEDHKCNIIYKIHAYRRVMSDGSLSMEMYYFILNQSEGNSYEELEEGWIVNDVDVVEE